MMSNKQRQFLIDTRKSLLERADAIVLDGGRLLPNDPLVRKIQAISRKLRSK